MTRVIRMTEQEYAEGAENGVGVCLACGAQADGVEPDARKYQCASCGQFTVYGLEEALLMGQVEFAEARP